MKKRNFTMFLQIFSLWGDKTIIYNSVLCEMMMLEMVGHYVYDLWIFCN